MACIVNSVQFLLAKSGLDPIQNPLKLLDNMAQEQFARNARENGSKDAGMSLLSITKSLSSILHRYFGENDLHIDAIELQNDYKTNNGIRSVNRISLKELKALDGEFKIVISAQVGNGDFIGYHTTIFSGMKDGLFRLIEPNFPHADLIVRQTVRTIDRINNSKGTISFEFVDSLRLNVRGVVVEKIIPMGVITVTKTSGR